MTQIEHRFSIQWPKVKCKPCHLLTKWPWTSHFPSEFLSLLNGENKAYEMTSAHSRHRISSHPSPLELIPQRVHVGSRHFYNFWSEVKKWSEVAQLCLTLCNPIDCSLPGSSVHRISQARTLEWVAISFSRRSSRPRNWTLVSHIVDRCFTIWATREPITFEQTINGRRPLTWFAFLVIKIS